MFATRQVLQKCREYNVSTHHLFFDFKSAYDTIDREQLWQIMHEYGFPDKLVRLIKATMDRMMCVVRVSKKKTLHRLQPEVAQTEHSLTLGDFTKSVQLLGFAGDIDIIAHKFQTMAEMYIRIKSETR